MRGYWINNIQLWKFNHHYQQIIKKIKQPIAFYGSDYQIKQPIAFYGSDYQIKQPIAFYGGDYYED